MEIASLESHAFTTTRSPPWAGPWFVAGVKIRSSVLFPSLPVLRTDSNRTESNQGPTDKRAAGQSGEESPQEHEREQHQHQHRTPSISSLADTKRTSLVAVEQSTSGLDPVWLGGYRWNTAQFDREANSATRDAPSFGFYCPGPEDEIERQAEQRNLATNQPTNALQRHWL
jgi:hypothetical protein